jgi:hypothetical protein
VSNAGEKEQKDDASHGEGEVGAKIFTAETQRHREMQLVIG